MEKLYDDKKYSQMAEVANGQGEFLYQYVHPISYDVEVPEWNKKEVQQEIFDTETGEIIGTQMVEINDFDNPIMIEEEIIDFETNEKKIISVQKHHTETRTKEVAELLIAPENYYICYKDNYTDGTVNENFEAELQAKEQQRISNLKCTKRVFVLMLEKLGINYLSDIKPVIEADPKIQLEWDLCVELLRSNPLLDKVAEKFNISSKQLDDLFRYANGEIAWEEDK